MSLLDVIMPSPTPAAPSTPASPASPSEGSTLTSITSALSSVFLGSEPVIETDEFVPAQEAETELDIDQDLKSVLEPESEPETLMEQLSPHALIVQSRKPAATGCSMHAGFKTAILISDIEGDTDKLHRIIKHAQRWAAIAKGNNNEVHLAFLGDFSPDRAFSPIDTLAQLLSWKKKGFSMLKARSGRSVHCVLGGREMALLRLVDRGDRSEVALGANVRAASREAVEIMQRTLKRPPPLVPTEWKVYTEAVTTIFGALDLALTDEDSIAKAHGVVVLCTLLKLEALLSMTKRAGYVSESSPGFLRNVLRRRLKPADYAAFASDAALRCSPTDGAWLPAQVIRFIDKDGKNLNEEGLALVPVALAALAAVSTYISETVLPLLRLSVLVGYIEPPNDEDAENAAWLMHAGTSDGHDEGNTIVGKLPESVKIVDGAPRVEWTETLAGDWPQVLNDAFQSFLERWVSGDDAGDEGAVWIALSIPSSKSGPTESEHRLPLEGLGREQRFSPTLGAVGHVAAPFPLIIKKYEMDKYNATTVGWTINTNVEGYATDAFGVITWCAKTKREIKLPRLKSTDLESHQFDMDCVLKTLVAQLWSGEDAREREGVLGPMVKAGRDGREVLRLVWWEDVLTLLPEGFLRTALKLYNSRPPPTRVAGAVISAITLTTADILEMEFPGISEAEAVEFRKEVGPRIWKTKSQHGANLQGQPITTFVTISASFDPLVGLRVAWHLASAKHVTIVAAPSQHEYQTY